MKRLLVFAVALLVTAPLGTQAASTPKDAAGQKKKTQRAGDLKPAASPAPKEITLPAEGDDRSPMIPGAGRRGTRPHVRQKYVPGQTQLEKIVAKPRELKLKRAPGHSGVLDLRALPYVPQTQRQRRELPDPLMLFPPPAKEPQSADADSSGVLVPTPKVQAPAPLFTFDGLDRFNWGAGSPPDTNGDVGPVYYIQTVNTSIGIYRKSDQAQVAVFTFNTFMSQGNFGNLCDTDNFGDPVVLYDTFEDRWVITDFAFKLDISGNVVAPAFQCFAASKTGDPVSGGWNFYSIAVAGGQIGRASCRERV